jgi:AbrB family looped-hinge helix DNA binding protein
MKSTIDSAGRLVIPKRIRQEAGIDAGASLDIRFQDGRIEIEPAPLPVRLVRKGRLTVAVPKVPVPRLTGSQVERTRDQLRAERVHKR